MKKIFLLFLSFSSLLSLTCLAQDQNSQAVVLFTQAEHDFEAQQYERAVDRLNEAINKIGQPNSKLLYLKVRALEKIYFKNFDRTTELDSSLSLFFKTTNKSTYPEDKYLDILKIKTDFDEFRKKDRETFRQIKDEYQGRKSRSTVNSTIVNYLAKAPNTYFRSELQLYASYIQQKETSKINRNEKKNVFKNDGAFSFLQLGYGVASGPAAKSFVEPGSVSEVAAFWNGNEGGLGAKYRLYGSLFDVGIKLFTTSTLKFSLNWTLFEGEYQNLNWENNEVYYKPNEYGDDRTYYKNVGLYRLGTKLGPNLTTGLVKNKIKFDFYYNIRPGYFLLAKKVNFATTADKEYTIGNSKFAPENVSLAHEFGMRLRYKALVINPYITTGKYNLATDYTQGGSYENGSVLESFKNTSPYRFIGINIGVDL